VVSLIFTAPVFLCSQAIEKKAFIYLAESLLVVHRDRCTDSHPQGEI
jgi:hypothetical protein